MFHSTLLIVYQEPKTLIPGPQETGDGKITRPEDEAEMVELMLKYLYGLNYESTKVDAGSSESGPVKASDEWAVRRKSVRSRPYTSSGLLPCGHENDRDCEEYCVNYRINSTSTSPGNGEQLITHAKMYAIADKNQITGLKALVTEKFRSACEHHWERRRFLLRHISFTNQHWVSIRACGMLLH